MNGVFWFSSCAIIIVKCVIIGRNSASCSTKLNEKRAIITITLALISIFAYAQHQGQGNLKYVDPLIGNVGHLLQPTRPTAQLPNQMMRMFPQRADYTDDQISSFPLIVVSHRLGEAFAFKPTVNPVTTDSWKERMSYDHDLEITRPWYYSTYLLDNGMQVEFAPGKKVGIYKVQFPASGTKSLLFNLYNDGEGSFTFLSDREIQGMETYNGKVKVYMYGIFDVAGTAGTLNNQELSRNRKVYGRKVGSYITFPSNTREVSFKYAISYISAEQARKNFNNELGNAGFDQLKTSGEEAWSKVINQVKVEGGTEAQKRTFYTSLYRSFERMVDITEDGSYFSGFDDRIHTTDRPFYVDDWAWDSYLAHHPLRVLLDPVRQGDMLNSYVKMYEQSGWMPTFPVLFGDHACMNGFHSSIVFLDSYRKGIRGYDVEKAYEGMLKNATQATMIPWRNGPKTALDDFYHSKGYFPALPEGGVEIEQLVDKFEKRQAVAVTLGGSYDDWAVAEMARELGKKNDYKKLIPRALNYKKLWNEKFGMFMPRDSSGRWIDIDPKFDGGMGGREYYDENNGWTYKWQVQHDIPGLISLMGGAGAFEQELDQLFREHLGRSKYQFWSKFPDATGLVGQFSMGNEPSFHIPYLYNFTGSPWKTQKQIRFLLDLWFKDNVFGIPGDEDGGGMTSFVVFSSMGFYPIAPGLPLYTIGSPVFRSISIDLPNGKKFQVHAKNSSSVNKYIQKARLNGEDLESPMFSHEQLSRGGVLEFEMGPKPGELWKDGKTLTSALAK